MYFLSCCYYDPIPRRHRQRGFGHVYERPHLRLRHGICGISLLNRNANYLYQSTSISVINSWFIFINNSNSSSRLDEKMSVWKPLSLGFGALSCAVVLVYRGIARYMWGNVVWCFNVVPAVTINTFASPRRSVICTWPTVWPGCRTLPPTPSPSGGEYRS